MIRVNRCIGLILLIAILLSHSVVAHTDKIPSLQSAEFGNQIRYFDTDFPFRLPDDALKGEEPDNSPKNMYK